MDFENFNEVPKSQTEQETTTETEQETSTSYTDLPRLEDLLKSESEIAATPSPTLKGLKQVDLGKKSVERTFARKEDEKRTFVKRRVKILTGVYAIVFALLLGFVGINTATIINRGISSNTATQNIEIANTALHNTATTPESSVINELELTVNTPRDYGDDTTPLTFFDRITILFRSLFG